MPQKHSAIREFEALIQPEFSSPQSDQIENPRKNRASANRYPSAPKTLNSLMHRVRLHLIGTIHASPANGKRKSSTFPAENKQMKNRLSNDSTNSTNKSSSNSKTPNPKKYRKIQLNKHLAESPSSIRLPLAFPENATRSQLFPPFSYFRPFPFAIIPKNLNPANSLSLSPHTLKYSQGKKRGVCVCIGFMQFV